MDANPDFCDLLQASSGANVRYLVVGAHAVGYHTERRYTKDLDVCVDSQPENAARVWNALRQFGAPLFGVSVADLANPDMSTPWASSPIASTS
jgi:hypothetical protein